MTPNEIAALTTELTMLRTKVRELSQRVIDAESKNQDDEALKRENAELRRQLAEFPTTRAAIEKLREWAPEYNPGATHVMMAVAMARKLLAAIEEANAQRDAVLDHG